MPYDEGMAERIRELFQDYSDVEEKSCLADLVLCIPGMSALVLLKTPYACLRQ